MDKVSKRRRSAWLLASAISGKEQLMSSLTAR